MNADLEKLTNHLRTCGDDDLLLNFSEIETISGGVLPNIAYSGLKWWRNRDPEKFWCRANFEVVWVLLKQKVRFRRKRSLEIYLDDTRPSRSHLRDRVDLLKSFAKKQLNCSEMVVPLKYSIGEKKRKRLIEIAADRNYDYAVFQQLLRYERGKDPDERVLFFHVRLNFDEKHNNLFCSLVDLIMQIYQPKEDFNLSSDFLHFVKSKNDQDLESQIAKMTKNNQYSLSLFCLIHMLTKLGSLFGLMCECDFEHLCNEVDYGIGPDWYLLPTNQMDQVDCIYFAMLLSVMEEDGYFHWIPHEISYPSLIRIARSLCLVLLEMGEFEKISELGQIDETIIQSTPLVERILSYSLSKKDLTLSLKYAALLEDLEPKHPLVQSARKEIRIMESYHRLKQTASFDIDQIDSLTGIQFEILLRDKFVSFGYQAETTAGSGDFGADLLVDTANGTRFVIQCKRFKSKVNLKAVQEVVAALGHYGGDIGIVITNSGFLNSAIKLAESNDIELWDSGKLLLFLAGDLSFSQLYTL